MGIFSGLFKSRDKPQNRTAGSDVSVISEVVEETLRVYSENYNMRVICEKAGISYSTYRGFKNNNQPFSTQKALQLLRCMFEIGSSCWNNEFEKKLQFFNRHTSMNALVNDSTYER